MYPIGVESAQIYTLKSLYQLCTAKVHSLLGPRVLFDPRVTCEGMDRSCTSPNRADSNIRTNSILTAPSGTNECVFLALMGSYLRRIVRAKVYRQR